MNKLAIRSSQGPKSVSVVGGGEVVKSFLSSICASEMCIGVDRGALWLIQHKIVPDLSIGDFDSVSAKERAIIVASGTRVMAYPAEKDATDLELAVDEAIRLKVRQVFLYGVLGRRFDHGMGAIAALRRLVSHNIYGEIVDNYSKINIVRREKKKFSRDPAYPYVSVLPLTSRPILTLSGFRYNVSKKLFSMQSTIGISNQIPGSSATVSVHQGAVLIVRSRD